MNLKDTVQEIAKKANQELEKGGVTEEATKMGLILPMFSSLGYNVFDTDEFCPEYTADYGIKKGEKVDYAILKDGKPLILIECKAIGEKLDNYLSQLYRYFSVSPAKFGILTNGLEYRFYTDLENVNQMDFTPFLSFTLDTITDRQISALEKFSKDNFDQTAILGDAEQMKYTNLITNYLAQQFTDMDDEYATFILKKVYNGHVTKNVLAQYKPLIKKSFAALIGDQVNKKISQALNENPPADNNSEPEVIQNSSEEKTEQSNPKIVTTDEEIEAFYLVRGILAGTVPVEDVVSRDRQTYFGILYQDNNRKPICRLYLDKKKKYISIPDKEKNFTFYEIKSLDDIYQYKELLVNAVNNYMKK